MIRWRFRVVSIALATGLGFLASSCSGPKFCGVCQREECRNLAFTYFDPAHQRAVLEGLVARLLPGGALVVGSHESLPEHGPELAPWGGAASVFRLGEARTPP